MIQKARGLWLGSRSRDLAVVEGSSRAIEGEFGIVCCIEGIPSVAGRPGRGWFG